MTVGQPDPNRSPYLGMKDGDLDGEWFAKYWNPQMAPLPDHVAQAIDVSPVAPPLCLDFAEMGTLADPGYQQLENGYSLLDDGAMHVAVRTDMPRVTAEMWDWWFWWHATQTERYKLWYPRAHLYAEWDGPEFDPDTPYRDRYIDGNSFVDEYVANAAGQLAIQFKSPASLGFDQSVLDEQGATVICGIVGLSSLPIDWGYLAHYVRPVEGGAEMRSRFWMGGEHVKVRDGATLPDAASGAVDALTQMGEDKAKGMVVHCSQEMNHLAAFLPDIYAEYQTRS